MGRTDLASSGQRRCWAPRWGSMNLGQVGRGCRETPGPCRVGVSTGQGPALHRLHGGHCLALTRSFQLLFIIVLTSRRHIPHSREDPPLRGRVLGGAPVPCSSPRPWFPPVNTRDTRGPVASLREHSAVAVTAGCDSLHTSLAGPPGQSRGTCGNRAARPRGPVEGGSLRGRSATCWWTRAQADSNGAHVARSESRF